MLHLLPTFLNVLTYTLRPCRLYRLCTHQNSALVTERRSGWACTGHPKLEQETIEGTHARETPAHQRRPTTLHEVQGTRILHALSSVHNYVYSFIKLCKVMQCSFRITTVYAVPHSFSVWHNSYWLCLCAHMLAPVMVCTHPVMHNILDQYKEAGSFFSIES